MSLEEIKVGITGKRETEVTVEKTASHIGSGGLRVYATPEMINLMEETSWSSVEPYLEEGMGTVGTAVNIKHLAASPVGAHIVCESKLIEVDRRRLLFDVKVYDERGLVGDGQHERFIIDNEKFMGKLKKQLGIEE